MNRREVLLTIPIIGATSLFGDTSSNEKRPTNKEDVDNFDEERQKRPFYSLEAKEFIDELVLRAQRKFNYSVEDIKSGKINVFYDQYWSNKNNCFAFYGWLENPAKKEILPEVANSIEIFEIQKGNVLAFIDCCGYYYKMLKEKISKPHIIPFIPRNRFEKQKFERLETYES